MRAAQFAPLTVSAITRETEDAVAVTLIPRLEDAARFAYTAGQHLTFRTHLHGEEQRRSYSICAAEQENTLRVGIKRVAGGIFSTWANTALKLGDTLESLPPAGNFGIPPNPNHHKHYAAFAAGSGVTPILGIIRTLLLGEPHSRVSLFYGNRSTASILFREELEDLKNRYMQRFSLTHILSRERQEIPLFNGRLNRETCAPLFAQWFDVRRVDTAFLCGPQAMMEEIATTLGGHGLAKEQIRFELFGTPVATHPAPLPAAESTNTRHATATIIIDGRARQIPIASQGITILDAALAAGLELPYACKAGVCSTCRAKLINGRVAMDTNHALDTMELAQGYILCCQSRPQTETLTVDFDM